MKHLLVHVFTVPISLQFISGQPGFMKDRGIETHVVASPGPKLWEFSKRETVQFFSVEMPRRITPLRDIKAVFSLVRFFLRLRPHIVHAHTPKGGLIGTISAWLAGIPIRIYHIHGFPFMTTKGIKNALLRFTEKVSCRLAHRVFCVSPSLRDFALSEGICDSRKIVVLGHGSINGIDAINYFNPDIICDSDVNSVKEKYRIPKDAPVIGFIGRIVPDKGILELIEAWKILRDEFPKLHLLLVGSFEDQNPIPLYVKKIIDEDSRIHRTGFINAIHLIYSALDILILPSYREGLGIVALEAASMRVPVVATRIPGCVDAVEEGSTGILVPVADTNALADGIRAYLTNPLLCAIHGQAGRSRVLREFCPEDLWVKLHREYIKLLTQKQVVILNQ